MMIHDEIGFKSYIKILRDEEIFKIHLSINHILHARGASLHVEIMSM